MDVTLSPIREWISERPIHTIHVARSVAQLDRDREMETFWTVFGTTIVEERLVDQGQIN